MKLSTLAASITTAILFAGFAGAATIADTTGTAIGGGNFSGVGAHSYYGVTFSTSVNYTNVQATAALEGNFHSDMVYGAYLVDITAGSSIVASNSVLFSAPYPPISYNLFSSPLSLNAGDTYLLALGWGGGANPIWDATNASPTLGANFTLLDGFLGSDSFFLTGAYSHVGPGNLQFTLSGDENVAPEPGTLLLGIAGAAAVALSRRKR